MMKQPRRILVAFGDNRLRPSAMRLARQAAEMCVYDRALIMNERDLEPVFRARHRSQPHRSTPGFGYWVWKPEVLQQVGAAGYRAASRRVDAVAPAFQVNGSTRGADHPQGSAADRQFAAARNRKAAPADCLMENFSRLSKTAVVVKFDCNRINAFKPVYVFLKNNRLSTLNIHLQQRYSVVPRCFQQG